MKEVNCLLLKLLMDKYYNKEALKSLMINLWKSMWRMSFTGVGYDVFMVIFIANEE